MSNFKRFWVVALVIAVFLPASAQFKIGPRLGIEVNSLRFDKSLFESSNRAGFTGGVQAEFTVPLIGVGADLSVMYAHRSSKYMNEQNLSVDASKDYIEIPLNFKYKVNIPAISSFFAPYLFTGPSFAFLCSKQAVTELIEAKKCDIAWNVGLGFEIIKHLQIGASYGFGLTKALQAIDVAGPAAGIEGKNRYWTVTAAWLF